MHGDRRAWHGRMTRFVFGSRPAEETIPLELRDGRQIEVQVESKGEGARIVR
ncbi:hypothetical protein [Sorangium cellulosum]|uniref:Uncharacterized protein n=1 Tax=Sorangium cellulosum So0157-2 TaxID=1254432 RepID=S4XV06_SORCE|nr:hypothetical protein [Sorangium cellulosum]AGP36344.1 hypothetical protein SCE1572_18720 [Sorangium cellulosum So0157-2]